MASTLAGPHAPSCCTRPASCYPAIPIPQPFEWQKLDARGVPNPRALEQPLSCAGADEGRACIRSECQKVSTPVEARVETSEIFYGRLYPNNLNFPLFNHFRQSSIQADFGRPNADT